VHGGIWLVIELCQDIMPTNIFTKFDKDRKKLFDLESGNPNFGQLKMLGLYLYTLIIGHKSCKMLSILNKLTLQKDLRNVVTKKCVFGQKVKTQQEQDKKCRSRELNPRPLAPKPDALPLHHRVN